MKARGLGVIELLVSLLVSGLLFAFVSKAILDWGRMYFKTRLEEQRVQSRVKLISIVERALSNMDQHRFKLPPRVHSNGRITFTDLSLNPVMLRGSATTRPASGSWALTSIGLDSRETLVAKVSSGGGFSGCTKYGVKISDLSKLNGFLGVAPDGLIELSVSGLSLSSAGRCLAGELRATKSMTVPVNPKFELNTLRLLVPIFEHYTYYVSDVGTLRYLSHRGAINIENQPILELSEKLKFSLRPALNAKFWELKFEFFNSTLTTFTYANVNHLSREEFYNVLFNS